MSSNFPSLHVPEWGINSSLIQTAQTAGSEQCFPQSFMNRVSDVRHIKLYMDHEQQTIYWPLGSSV